MEISRRSESLKAEIMAERLYKHAADITPRLEAIFDELGSNFYPHRQLHRSVTALTQTSRRSIPEFVRSVDGDMGQRYLLRLTDMHEDSVYYFLAYDAPIVEAITPENLYPAYLQSVTTSEGDTHTRLFIIDPDTFTKLFPESWQPENSAELESLTEFLYSIENFYALDELF